MTARAMKKDREGCIETGGMDEYISKPIHSKEWNEVVVRNLVRKPVLTPGDAHHRTSHSRPPNKCDLSHKLRLSSMSS